MCEVPWETEIESAIRRYIASVRRLAPETSEHTELTASRVRANLEYMISGYEEKPEAHLKLFPCETVYDEMVHVRRIRIVSTCSHHLERIIGIAHFAYIPSSSGIVGLSKIPRFIDVLSRRLQVQENLTQQIVDTFQYVIGPKGCAVNIRAYHMCMLARGVKEHSSITETTAFRGCFKKVNSRQEFLTALDRTETIFP